MLSDDISMSLPWYFYRASSLSTDIADTDHTSVNVRGGGGVGAAASPAPPSPNPLSLGLWWLCGGSGDNRNPNPIIQLIPPPNTPWWVGFLRARRNCLYNIIDFDSVDFLLLVDAIARSSVIDQATIIRNVWASFPSPEIRPAGACLLSSLQPTGTPWIPQTHRRFVIVSSSLSSPGAIEILDKAVDILENNVDLALWCASLAGGPALRRSVDLMLNPNLPGNRVTISFGECPSNQFAAFTPLTRARLPIVTSVQNPQIVVCNNTAVSGGHFFLEESYSLIRPGYELVDSILLATMWTGLIFHELIHTAFDGRAPSRDSDKMYWMSHIPWAQGTTPPFPIPFQFNCSRNRNEDNAKCCALSYMMASAFKWALTNRYPELITQFGANPGWARPCGFYSDGGGALTESPWTC